MRIALYLRVSKSDGSQDPVNQAHELQAFCERSGWQIVERYTDHASGKRNDRVEFKRLMNDAAKKKFDLVLFWALDRFSREGVRATLNYLKLLDDCKVGYRSYQESWLDTTGPLKDMMISIWATFAALERARISERTLAGLATARRKGKVLGRPFADFDRAKALTLHAAGKSLRAIAVELGTTAPNVWRHLKTAGQAS
jgi:DNA invertase Pin-like site-specific DNA recombinase